jgi:hypothetical protein
MNSTAPPGSLKTYLVDLDSGLEVGLFEDFEARKCILLARRIFSLFPI